MFVPVQNDAPMINDGALVQNGRAAGPFGALGQVAWDHGYLRPYINERDGKPYVIVNQGGHTLEKGERVPIKRPKRVIDVLNQGIVHPVLLSANATALRKEAWIQLDRTVQLAYRARLKAWNDLVGMSSVGGFNAMAHTTYEYEVMSDPGEALVDMDGLGEGRGDKPLFNLRSIPLPITHSSWWTSARQLTISRNTDKPLDMAMPEACSRRIGECVEKTLIGVSGGFSGLAFGGQTSGVTQHDTSAGLDTLAALGASTVYGYTTFPHRLTKTNFTAPTAGGWVPDTTRNELLTALSHMYDNFIYGPFRLYYSTDWSQYMERVYSVSGGNNVGETLRSMILKTEGITSCERLDYLTSTFTLILVSTGEPSASAINGQDITTLQWDAKGGMQINYRHYVIQVPLFRSDFNRRCGILHGTTT